MLKIFYLFIFISIFNNVYSYPNYIGHGYNSCITCHYNPFGNGPLNDYGRGLSATGIASRAFYDVNRSEESLGERSGFAFRQFKQAWFRPAFDYRGMLLKRSFGEPNESTRFIHMQGDAHLTIILDKEAKYIVTGSFGYAPQPFSRQDKEELKKYRSREHYVGVRVTEKVGIYAGLMDKPFGIRVAEHVAFSRSVNNLDQNDQSHGAVFHFNNNKLEFGLNYFIGNLVQEESLRQKGFSSIFEYTTGKNTRVGVSYLDSKSTFLSQNSKAIHVRTAAGKGSSILFELGQSSLSSLSSTSSRETNYSIIQNHVNLKRGLYLLNSLEYLKLKQQDFYTLRLGPGIQYFPVQRIELRADLYNTRNFSKSQSNDDSWDFLGQIHIWL